MIVDADTKFTDEFRSILRDGGVKCVRTPHLAPDCNSVAKRRVLSIKSEALNRMIFFGVVSESPGGSAHGLGTRSMAPSETLRQTGGYGISPGVTRRGLNRVSR
ncbi:MAG: hypothetical protein V2A76_04830 [Planctomycetota bacterium]